MIELRKIFPQFPGFLQHQHMFFDLSMETIDHIDSWYLDTNPRGSLIGAWIALENISLKGGCFHIYPKSHFEVHENEFLNLNHDQFIKWTNKKIANFTKKNI